MVFLWTIGDFPGLLNHRETTTRMARMARMASPASTGQSWTWPSIDAVRLSVEELDGDQRKAHTPARCRPGMGGYVGHEMA